MKTFSLVLLVSLLAMASPFESLAQLLVLQIDFQADPGGAWGSKDPITSNHDIKDGGVWNAFQVTATDDRLSNSVENPSLSDLVSSSGSKTGVNLTIRGKLIAYNTDLIGEDSAAFNAALGDHIFWAQGSATDPLVFTFDGLPAGRYTVIAYCNPTKHNPPRDFRFSVGETTVDINPAFEGEEKVATLDSVIGEIAGVHVGSEGILRITFGKIGGDPSLAALVLKQAGE